MFELTILLIQLYNPILWYFVGDFVCPRGHSISKSRNAFIVHCTVTFIISPVDYFPVKVCAYQCTRGVLSYLLCLYVRYLLLVSVVIEIALEFSVYIS